MYSFINKRRQIELKTFFKRRYCIVLYFIRVLSLPFILQLFTDTYSVFLKRLTGKLSQINRNALSIRHIV